MADPRMRQIKIKTGVVKWLVKEKVMYEKEAKQQEEKIEKMKAEDGEHYAIKKQAEILGSTRQFIILERAQLKIIDGRWWRMPLIPALGRRRHADLCEFEASLGYQVSSRKGTKLHRETLSRKTKKK
uniref:Tubulin-specific chaperone A n=1 Tax=Peromyscus maniculatus bairdii TaxID=230844 RepID=A0A8C8W3E5_PERMB